MLSRCRRFLAIALYEGSIRFWDLDLKCRVTTIYDHEKAVYSLSWSHDERILASKSFDNTVRLWRCDTWAQLALIEERSFEQLEIACHPTREEMVTFNKRNTSLRLWAIDTNILYQSNYPVKQVAETLQPADQLIHMLTKIDQRTEKLVDQPSRVIHTQRYFEKVEGGYHEHNYAQEQDLTEAATAIQKLLDQLAKTYPNNTDEATLVQAIQVEIKRNPTLKARLINALKSGGVEALKAIFNHPL
ncbi:MAG: hypothetical protein HC878_18700 [Leptolyngbyaceae cyanobacterium SL_5_14]|nr:hypothetical protein [Leptolyngbyaceae cyanobacterium SL_5_14]